MNSTNTYESQKQTILVIDDLPENIDIIHEVLSDDYRILAAVTGEKGLALANLPFPPDLILLDIMMPGMDGYEVCRRLKDRADTRNIPVIFVSALNDVEDEYRGLELGAVDYITKPFSPPIVKARIKNHLDLKCHRDHLEMLVLERTHELELTQEATIESMAVLAEYRDPETGGHIKRTQNYVRALAERLKDHPKYCSYLTPEVIALLYKSAPLHDIGKVGIPDNILLKPGKLTPEEFEIMKKHAAYGHDTIRATEKTLGRDFSFLHYAGEIALTHHEKWDGSGYPQGLSGEDIPIPGRLMAVVDVYDALISKRVYKPPMPHDRAISIIKDGGGSHFDPEMVKAMLEISDKFLRIALEFADFEEERQMLLTVGDDSAGS
ncbi:MAG: two-component system response regulator [Proteobacteria bacterium]|nr:two-component system response regulator [Pseudomonadota bacterium]MBU1685844.1 two-component system response regulator [Pseudomonadota bacterium]